VSRVGPSVNDMVNDIKVTPYHGITQICNTEGGLKNCESVVRMLIGIFWGFTMELHADRCNPYLLFIVRTYGVQRLRLGKQVALLTERGTEIAVGQVERITTRLRSIPSRKASVMSRIWGQEETRKPNTRKKHHGRFKM